MGFLSRSKGKRNNPPDVQQALEGGRLREVSPEGDLEHSIAALRAGRTEIQEVARMLIETRIFMPSTQGPAADPAGQGFKPVVVELPDGLFVPVFTSAARADILQEMNLAASSGIETGGAWVVSNLPPELGLYINPGWSTCLMLPAATLAHMRGHFAL